MIARAFPEQERRLFGGEPGFAQVDNHFLTPTSGRAVAASFPRRAADPIVLTESTGFSIAVTELGVEGARSREGAALVASLPKGAAIWRAVDRGVEEWVQLDPGVAYRGREVAAWRVAGGKLQRTPRGDVAVMDANGVPRLRVIAPEGFTTSGRRVRVELGIRDDVLTLSADAGGEAALIDPAWISAGSMVHARTGHALTVLADGRVLATGGDASGTAEIYDPGIDAWAPVAPMHAAHADHQTRLIPDGRVVVGAPDGVDIYDPTTDTWTARSFGVQAGGGVTVLADGKVLAAGGYPGTYFVSGEGYYPVLDYSSAIYDPITNVAQTNNPLAQPHINPFITALPDGRGLLVGKFGHEWGFNSSVEVLDPATHQWVFAGFSQGPSLGVSGQTLFLAGFTSGALEVYDLQLLSHTTTPFPNGPTDYLGSAIMTLDDGRFAVVGGATQPASVYVFDPAGLAWSPGPTLLEGRYRPAAALLHDGSVLVSGGEVAPNQLTATSERWGPGLSGLGIGCATDNDCTSGFCVDSVCCDTLCDAACSACTTAQGSSAPDGTCGPIQCLALDECHDAGDCDPNGTCSDPPKPDGAPCSVGICVSGACENGQGGGGAGVGGSGGAATGGASSGGASNGGAAPNTGGIGPSGGGGAIGTTGGSGGDASTSEGGAGASNGASSQCGCSTVPSNNTLGTSIGLAITGLLCVRRRRPRRGPYAVTVPLSASSISQR